MDTVSFEDITIWGEDAVCKGKPQEWWYPENFNSAGCRKDVTRAKLYCQICPVKTHCLQYALKYNEEHGVWGGMTPSERGNSRSYRNKVRVASRV
jgi:WhiB family redox-sensing transcriptional regulator